MTFIKNKFFKSINKTDITGQDISTAYVESPKAYDRRVWGQSSEQRYAWLHERPRS